MQVELLNRKKWRTRVSLANAMFDFIESSYNHNRRHSRLGRSTPIEHELRLKHQAVPQRIPYGENGSYGDTHPTYDTSTRRPTLRFLCCQLLNATA